MKLIHENRLDNNDHAFAKWLFSQDWTHTTRRTNANMFFNKADELLAIAFYDNAKCTFEVHIDEERKWAG